MMINKYNIHNFNDIESKFIYFPISGVSVERIIYGKKENFTKKYKLY